jgi:F-type H+-transporting ATPase subunit gamma
VSQLAQLRQKIRSVKTTKKITHAVRLVSMSFYNKLDKMNKPLQDYSAQIKDAFFRVLQQDASWTTPVLFPVDSHDTAPLYIIVATSKGLCGSLNSNLFKYINSQLATGNAQHAKFIAIGQRAVPFIKESGRGEVVASYQELNSNNFITIADNIVEKILQASQPFSSVTVFTSEAKSFFLQQPLKSKLIPLSKAEMQLETERNNFQTQSSNSIIWEQEVPVILDYLAVRYMRSAVIALLFQGLRAEQAARFLAMENSTKNAEKYLDRLTLQFNKLRQGLITKEITELSADSPEE